MADGPAPLILVLRHHGLGDLVTAQPALRALRKAFPEHRLVCTCPSWLLPLAECFGTADQFISEIVSGSSRANATVDPTCHQQVDVALLANVLAEAGEVDVIISLRTPGPELPPVVDVLAPRLLVSYRTDLIGATANFPTLDFTDHILVRWQRLLSTIDILPCDEDMYRELAVPESCRRFTIIHIGAGSPSRLWPLARWVEVTDHLHQAGHQIALTGSRSEEPLIAELARRVGLPAHCDCSDTDIQALAQLVAGARLVVSTDTGVAHLATAFRRPAVTLFGPVPPAWWGPPPGNPQHRTLWAGKTGDTYGSEADLGLLELTVGDVLCAIDELRRIELI